MRLATTSGGERGRRIGERAQGAGSDRSPACALGLPASPGLRVLDPHERTAALALLASRIPGVAAADLDVTRKSVAPPRRISGRRRERAGELCIRFAECAEALRKSEQ